LRGRRDHQGARSAQGVILTWAANGENTVSFRGQTYVNMPFQTIGNTIPQYTGGDVVVIAGWAPEGRLSSWYIVGRIVIPPAQEPEA
jgi:hypothetical protein